MPTPPRHRCKGRTPDARPPLHVERGLLLGRVTCNSFTSTTDYQQRAGHAGGQKPLVRVECPISRSATGAASMPEAPAQINPHLWTVQSRLFQMNSGIFINNGEAVLIDPGMYPDEIAAIRSFVQEHGAKLQTIIVTHSHWDHILGPEWFPGVKVITQAAYPETVRAEQADILKVINGWAEKNSIVR